MKLIYTGLGKPQLMVHMWLSVATEACRKIKKIVCLPGFFLRCFKGPETGS